MFRRFQNKIKSKCDEVAMKQMKRNSEFKWSLISSVILGYFVIRDGATLKVKALSFQKFLIFS